MKLFLASFIYCLWLLYPKVSVAHGDVHEQILAVTDKIQAGGNRGELLLHRAELYRLDEDYLSALADCTQAAIVAPTNSLVHFVRARVLSAKKKFANAKTEIDQFLEMHPQHAEALLIRARALNQLGNIAEADRDYAAAIRIARTPEPDWYCEYAQMLQAAGQEKEALAVIESGFQRTGAVSLGLFAVDLAVELKDFENALRRLDTFCLQSSRKEKWLFRRGEVLEKAGRLEEACATFNQAEHAWATLPRQFQSSLSSQQLHTEIVAALRRLK